MMRRVMPFAALITLAACATLPVLDAPPAGVYASLDTPDQVFASPEEVVAYYVGAENTVDAEVQIGRDPTGLGTRLILVTTSGYEDDSVSGEQWRIALGQTDFGYRVLQAGIRYNCARGDNPGWSRQLCP